MRRLPVLLALAAVLTAALAAGAVTASPQPLLAAVGEGSATRLTAVDPLTLAPVGRSMQIGRYVFPSARSPDGTQLVLARTDRASLRVVDLRRMKTLRAFPLGGSYVDGIAWLEPRLVVAVVDGFRAVGVDPVSKRVRWRVALPNQVESIERSPSGFVLLVRSGEWPPSGIGPTTLLTIGAAGKLRSVLLDRIRSGADFTETPPTVELRRPGLAVDPVGNRAFVIGAGEPFAEVDLAAMTVAYHGGSGSRSLAKAVNGPERNATWLGNGLIAVTGSDAHSVVGTKDGQSFEHVWWTPAGLTLVDTKDWSSRLIDPNATSVEVANGLLLATAWTYDSAVSAATGIGLAAYSLDGTPRFHLLAGPVASIQAGAGMAYVRWPGEPG